jgi:hypothetical protein
MAISIIVDLQTFHTWCVGTFTNYLHTKFQMDTTLLFYNLQKYYLYESGIFSQYLLLCVI